MTDLEKKKLMTNKKSMSLLKKPREAHISGPIFPFFLFYKRQTTCYLPLKKYI
jgi:hypothetical protein